MPMYHYKARDTQGNDIEGDRDTKDEFELAKSLRAEGLLPFSVTKSSAKRKRRNIADYIPNFLKRVSLEDKMNFTRNTAVMIGAGLSLVKALEVMSRQTSNEKFRKIILAMAETIKQGKPFVEALEAYPEIFPKFYQEMVRAGEKSGNLENSLKLVALQLKKDYAIRKKIKSALIYPTIVLMAMVGISILMLIYVVPTLVSTFQDLKVELPASTKFIIFVSNFLLTQGILAAIFFIAIVYGARRFLRSQTGKDWFDWVVLKIPIIKGINQKFNSARTCRTLSSLISSGVDILEALTITEGVLQNHFYKRILVDAREKIQKGEIISKAFLTDDASKFYPPLVGEMMAVGEETGELSGMLLRLAGFYENEVNTATKDLSTVIEPFLMIIIGIGVGFFAVSMISPMYGLANAI